MISSENIVMIIGGPGCGKTSTANHIALSYAKRGFQIVPIKAVDEISSYGARGAAQVFIYNDPIGIFGLDISYLKIVERNERDIVTMFHDAASKLICTCRTIVYNEAKPYECFLTKIVVDLEDEKMQLNAGEEMSFLKCYTKLRKLENSICLKISREATYQMFPLSCRIFATKTERESHDTDIFFEPHRFSLKQFDQLKQRNNFSYACLVLCTLKNNALSDNDLRSQKLVQDAFKTCGVNKSFKNAIVEVPQTLSHLKETYITKNGSYYTFIHDSVFEVMAYHYGKCHPEMILEYLSSTYIANKMCLKEFSTDINDRQLCVTINSNLFEELAKRLLKDIKDFELSEVFLNRCWSNHEFTSVFIGELKEMEYSDIKKYFIYNRSLPDKSTMENKAMSILHNESTCYSLIMHRQRLLYEVNCKHGYIFNLASPKKHSTQYIRAMNWIVSYAPTLLLKYLIEEVSRRKENVNIIFGSSSEMKLQLLLLAIHSENKDMIRTILEYIGNKCINDVHHLGHTPLTLAVSLCRLDIVKFLLENKANPNICNEKSLFPIYYASVSGKVDVLNELLQHGADLNKGLSPITIASQLGHINVVEYLLEHGCTLDKGYADENLTLHYFAEMGDLQILKALDERNEDVDKCDQTGRTPLHLASRKGHKEIVKYLIEKRYDVNFCDRAGKTPLHYASGCGHTKRHDVTWNNFDPNVSCESSSLGVNEPEMNFLEIVKMLVRNHCCVNMRDNLGKTPLHYACKWGYDQIVKYLVQNGGNITIKDKEEKTPSDKAEENNHFHVVQTIRELNERHDFNHTTTYQTSILWTLHV